MVGNILIFLLGQGAPDTLNCSMQRASCNTETWSAIWFCTKSRLVCNVLWKRLECDTSGCSQSWCGWWSSGNFYCHLYKYFYNFKNSEHEKIIKIIKKQ